MKVSELLIKSKALIADPANWTQYHYARNKFGGDVEVADEAAVCFCSIGAIFRAEGETPDDEYDSNTQSEAIVALADAMDMNGCVAMFNDQNTHERVMEKWDLAIKNAQAKELM